MDRFVCGARLFDGRDWHKDKGVLVRAGRIMGIFPPGSVPEGAVVETLAGGVLAPGLVDLQVNGGGGVLFNERPTVEGIEAICAAHRAFGTTALLATLITDTPEVMARAVAAGAESRGVPGFSGLHLEGPHLAPGRRGAHAAGLLRPMGEEDLSALLDAKAGLETLLVTVAPERVTPEQIARLAGAGIVVSLGHSEADLAAARAAIAAGARLVTHLFNAMGPLAGRAPGLAGAALEGTSVWAGLIADGVHVDPVAIGVALRAKRGPGRMFLVSDAMASVGSDREAFSLNGRTVRRVGGALRLPDGTLAGADLPLIDGVRFMHRALGVELGEALAMAGRYPAQAIGRERELGVLAPGARADLFHLDDDLGVRGVWIGGERRVKSARW